MKFKVGDILISKLDYVNKFTEGKSYIMVELTSFYRDIITIIIDSGENYSFFDDCIDDYFYTKQEVRKMKLERIDNESR